MPRSCAVQTFCIRRSSSVLGDLVGIHQVADEDRKPVSTLAQRRALRNLASAWSVELAVLGHARTDSREALIRARRESAAGAEIEHVGRYHPGPGQRREVGGAPDADRPGRPRASSRSAATPKVGPSIPRRVEAELAAKSPHDLALERIDGQRVDEDDVATSEPVIEIERPPARRNGERIFGRLTQREEVPDAGGPQRLIGDRAVSRNTATRGAPPRYRSISACASTMWAGHGSPRSAPGTARPPPPRRQRRRDQRHGFLHEHAGSGPSASSGTPGTARRGASPRRPSRRVGRERQPGVPTRTSQYSGSTIATTAHPSKLAGTGRYR